MKILRIATAVITASALLISVAGPAFAWHPVGVIKKEVMNQTSGSALKDANTVDAAVAAKPGDLLKYVITVSNVGEADAKGYNDMADTVMTDTLPAGVELASNPAQRKITENIGLIKPGQSVKKEYVVKVTSQKDGDVIKNTACFTGDSTAHDKPQSKCDDALAKVSVPVVPTPAPAPTPTPTPAPTKPVPTPTAPKPVVTPVAQPVVATPQVLPATGPEAVIGGIVSVSAIAYGVHMYLRSKRALVKAQMH